MGVLGAGVSCGRVEMVDDVDDTDLHWSLWRSDLKQVRVVGSGCWCWSYRCFWLAYSLLLFIHSLIHLYMHVVVFFGLF